MAAGWAWLAYAAFIVYGSLLPFDFQPAPLDQVWAAFRAAPYLALGVESRADWVANGVLYVPLGVLGALALRRFGALMAAGCALAFALLLALVVEMAQVCFPPRTVSQNDLIAEAIGSVLGICAAPHLGGWWEAIQQVWRVDRSKLAKLALVALLAAQLLYGLFPYDLVLSPAEWRDKLASGHWGWLLARPSAERSWPHVALYAGAEVAMLLPVGVAWAARAATPQLGAVVSAALLGATLGVAIEVGQLFVVTGISQGLSVLTRAAGTAVGALVFTRWKPGSLPALRRWLSANLGWLLPSYAVVLVFAAGWGRQGWGGWYRAAENWAELRWTPLYYHYYTSEAIALTSLTSTVMMYAPFAALTWSRSLSAQMAATFAIALAVMVEAGKLPLVGIHPDPSNLWIAGATVWLAATLLERWTQPDLPAARARIVGQKADLPSLPRLQDHSVQAAARGWTQRPHAAALATLFVLVGASLTWPRFAPAVLLMVVLAFVAGWRRPTLVLALLPCAWPVLDLAPWTGRFFVDEFDLMAAAAFVAATAHGALGGSPMIALIRGLRVPWIAFAASMLLAACLPLTQAWPLDPNSFAHLYSPFNGLRIAKGVVWAALYVLLFRHQSALGAQAARMAWVGAVVGLALTLLAVVLERMAFVSLFDLASDYRVTGPFSAMNKGGAYIECFLAVGTVFGIGGCATRRMTALRALGMVLLLTCSAYALLVTYSRGGWAALALGAILVLVAPWRRRQDQRAPIGATVLVGASLVVAAVAVVSSPFASERLSAAERDLEVRLAHWKAALNLRTDSLLVQLFGMGVGRFPATHYWYSLTETRAAAFRIEPGDGNALLRLGPGATVYIDQIVDAAAGTELALRINLRGATPAAPVVAVSLCRKSLLTSADCETVEVKGIRGAARIWQTQEATMTPLPLPQGWAEALVPLRLSVATPGGPLAVDVDNIGLSGPDGRELVRNGSFAAGIDNWFFATDVDPPWHIHNLPLAVLFDQGWLGLAALAGLIGAALMKGARRAWRGQTVAGTAWAALAGLLVCGSLSTVIDEPRFLAVMLVLAWLCGQDDARRCTPAEPGDKRMTP